MTEEIKLSEEGDILWGALKIMREHTFTHNCEKCEKNYLAFSKALTAWVEKPAAKTKEGKGNGNKESKGQEKGDNAEAEDWEEFWKS